MTSAREVHDVTQYKISINQGQHFRSTKIWWSRVFGVFLRCGARVSSAQLRGGGGARGRLRGAQSAEHRERCRVVP